MTDRPTRAGRMAGPHIRDVIKTGAAEHGAGTRPVQLRKTNLDTGQVEQVLVPCGATLSSVCPSCAERAKVLRAAQCREGWHLEHEPVTSPDLPDDYQRWLAATLADLAVARDRATEHGQDTADLDDSIVALTGELARLGIRGSLGTTSKPTNRRQRSTRRRQDAPHLPRRQTADRPTARPHPAPAGRVDHPALSPL